MAGAEFTGSTAQDERIRLEGLGFECIASSDFLLGGGLLVEAGQGTQRLYTPIAKVNPEVVAALQLSDTFMGKPSQGLCLKIMQQPAPENTASSNESREFFEIGTDGLSSPMRDTGDEADSLAALTQYGIDQQLEAAGFAREAAEGDVTLLRHTSPQGELVGVVSANKLRGLFVPIDHVGSSEHQIDPGRLTIVGISEATDPYGSGPAGIRASNGWAEFTISPGFFGELVQPKIVREPTVDELGMSVIPQEIEPSGFIKGGQNTSEVIRGLTSLNNVTIEELSSAMRAGQMSEAGFLGNDESLIDVLVHDNDTVRERGLTHQQLAEPLRYLQELYEFGMLRESSSSPKAGVNDITIGGRPYAVNGSGSRGPQYSPFRDGTTGNYDLYILNLETGDEISVSALLSEMISRYGFYEGLGTSYRVAPEKIISMFPHLQPEAMTDGAEIDPVVALTSGQAQAAVLTNPKQVSRFLRLYKANLPKAREADITISFSTADELFWLLKNESDPALLAKLDTASLDSMEPTLLVIQAYKGVRKFTSVLSQLDRDMQLKIISLITSIDTSGQSSSVGESALTEILNASVKEIDGQLVRQPAINLLNKLEYTPTDFLQAFYEAAGGSYTEWFSRAEGAPKATRHSIIDLDEDRARALSQVFGEEIMPLMEIFGEALHIDRQQPPEEQIIALLKQYHLIGQAQEIADNNAIKTQWPALGVTDWLQVSQAVEAINDNDTPDTLAGPVQAILQQYGFPLQDIINARKLTASDSAQATILQLASVGSGSSRSDLSQQPSDS